MNRKDIDNAMSPAKPKYLALVRKFPLRLIQSEEENEAALAVLESLGERRPEKPLAPEEHDYIAVLAKLIEDYENSRYPRGPVSAAAMLAHLIEARGISQARLAADTGLSESTVSQLVRGSRPPGRRQIQILARYFDVDPVLLQGD
ncbi:MAG: helix-turn-helix domain-containing protein [Isosphaeraceae bacterium]